MIRLDRAQRAALAELRGPVRVVAGAGTGKTAVIAERFARLVTGGEDPASILVMTFTERAASEMRSRIEARLEGRSGRLHVGTFHALAQGWLREDGRRVGVSSDFRILEGADRWILARELMWDLGHPALTGSDRPDELVGPLLKLLEGLKQELVPLERLGAWARSGEGEDREQVAAAVQLFEAYAAACRRERRLDFDDLLVQAVQLLERHPDLRAAYGARFRWLMVDEYQDTNLAQERLVELLGQVHGNVCVVGDDDQAIYRFRGASRASMERFLASFPGAPTLRLGRNRRSSGRIVAAARTLIEHSPERIPKPLTAQARPGPRVEVRQHAQGAQEARAIAAEAARLVGRGVEPSEIAVLCRTHAIGRGVQAALAAAGLPYQVWGGQGFYERPEVRDLIAYLRLLDDPDDLVALTRVVSRPPAGLDPERALGRVRAASGLSPLEALAGWRPARSWAGTLLQLLALKERLGVDELFFELMERTRYLDLLPEPNPIERRRAVAGAVRFGERIEEFCAHSRDHSLRAFRAYLDLVLLSGEEEDLAPADGFEQAVQVMTIHQAKGLEFEAVFIPALVEGRLPQLGRKDRFELPAHLLEAGVRGREDHLAEERRLCYVAMTRARRRLYLSWAERYEGARPWRPSRFLGELAEAADSVRQVPAGPAPGPDRVPEEEPPARLGVRPAAGEVELSFSAIAAYRECPRQYWYRHQLRLPVAPSVEAVAGTVLHAVLAQAARLQMEGGSLSLEQLLALHQRGWQEASLPDPRRRPALEAAGREQLRRFWEAGGLTGRPVMVERAFTTGVDGGWWLRGIIDRVDQYTPPPTQRGGVVGSRKGSDAGSKGAGQGPWLVVDYKTGSPAPRSHLRRDLQLALYALGARQALGLDPLELEIVYLKTGRRVRVPADAELLEEARRIGTEVADGVRQGRLEARPERRRCQLCPYRLACSEAL